MRRLLFVVMMMLPLHVTMASASRMCVADSLAGESEIQEDVVVPPEYDGGIEKLYDFLRDNFQYPEDCEKRYVSGTIELKFIIEKSGDMSAIWIEEGLEEPVNDELIRVFKAMPMWHPATKNGVPVRYTVSMPVTLKISRKRNGDKSNWQL